MLCYQKVKFVCTVNKIIILHVLLLSCSVLYYTLHELLNENYDKQLCSHFSVINKLNDHNNIVSVIHIFICYFVHMLLCTRVLYTPY